MTHKGTVTIETPRLILRAFRREDAPAMFRNWANDPEVTKYLTWKPHTDVLVSQQVVDRWASSYKDPEFYQWAIVLKEIGEPIGSISVVGMHEIIDQVEIGYCIGRKWWHQGLTSEAFAAVISFLFEEVGVNRLAAKHDVNNPHSGMVMKKCGLTHEGTVRQTGLNNTGICDMCIWGILRSDYDAMKAASPDGRTTAADWSK